MNVSYLNQLREQIAESRKKGDPSLSPDALIILRISRLPPLPHFWETQIPAIFHDEGWAHGEATPPSLIFVSSEEAHFYFPRPRSSMNELISLTSSICTKVDGGSPSPMVYRCSASHLTNIAEVLAYFVLETDCSIRNRAQKLTALPLDHMTKKEFEETMASYPLFNCDQPGIFYRLPFSDESLQKEWTRLGDGDNSVLRISLPLSFNTFEENVSLLFNRS